MGLNAFEFYDLTPVEFYYAVKDFGELEKQRMELNLQATFEAARLQIFYGVLGNPNVKHKPQNPSQMFKFEWEKKTAKAQTVKEQEIILRGIAAAFNKKKTK